MKLELRSSDFILIFSSLITVVSHYFYFVISFLLPSSLPSFLPFSLFFLSSPIAYGSSQARSQIGATAAGLHHSHSNARSEPSL